MKAVFFFFFFFLVKTPTGLLNTLSKIFHIRIKMRVDNFKEPLHRNKWLYNSVISQASRYKSVQNIHSQVVHPSERPVKFLGKLYTKIGKETLARWAYISL